jgi:hypothetical protein
MIVGATMGTNCAEQSEQSERQSRQPSWHVSGVAKGTPDSVWQPFSYPRRSSSPCACWTCCCRRGCRRLDFEPPPPPLSQSDANVSTHGQYGTHRYRKGANTGTGTRETEAQPQPQPQPQPRARELARTLRGSLGVWEERPVGVKVSVHAMVPHPKNLNSLKLDLNPK